MGTVGRGRVLELWLLGPDVVVEPGEKLADTRAAEKSGKGKMLNLLRHKGERIEGTNVSYTCSSR